MKKPLLIILVLLASSQIKAQILKEKGIDVSIGFGISAPYDDVDIIGSGFYLQGEYVMTFSDWFDLRPYAGMILTKADDEEGYLADYKSTANAFLFGGKSRLTVPIPWIAPYVEVGVGASLGTFETYIPFTEIEKNGLILHIPFTMGLELGPKHNFDVELTYYFHPDAKQFVGAAAFGFSIPLND